MMVFNFKYSGKYILEHCNDPIYLLKTLTAIEKYIHYCETFRAELKSRDSEASRI